MFAQRLVATAQAISLGYRANDREARESVAAIDMLLSQTICQRHAAIRRLLENDELEGIRNKRSFNMQGHG